MLLLQRALMLAQDHAIPQAIQAVSHTLAQVSQVAEDRAALEKLGQEQQTNIKYTERACGSCGKPSTGRPQKCGRCKAIWYCDVACQRRAWPEHKYHCHPTAGAKANDASASTQ